MALWTIRVGMLATCIVVVTCRRYAGRIAIAVLCVGDHCRPAIVDTVKDKLPSVILIHRAFQLLVSWRKCSLRLQNYYSRNVCKFYNKYPPTENRYVPSLSAVGPPRITSAIAHFFHTLPICDSCAIQFFPRTPFRYNVLYPRVYYLAQAVPRFASTVPIAVLPCFFSKTRPPASIPASSASTHPSLNTECTPTKSIIPIPQQ